jgi:hypothetical protein
MTPYEEVMGVPAKKQRTPSRPIRYLVSADHRLRTLSMKRLSPTAKKTKHSSATPRTRTRVHSRRRTVPKDQQPSTVAGWSLKAAAVIALVATVALMASRQPSHETSPDAVIEASLTPAASEVAPPNESVHARVDVAPGIHAPSRADRSATPPTRDDATPARLKRSASASAPSSVNESARRESNVPPISTPKSETISTHTESSTPSVQLAASTSEAAPRVPSASPSELVTVTGCLEAEDGAFWLTDTSGDDAPKARSWKWGLLRKRSVSVALVDASNTLNLSRHVGERVTAAGTMVDRQMEARSLRSLARCD